MNHELYAFYKDKIILVTGGAGSIGSEIVKSLLQYKPKTIRILDNSESGLFNIQQNLKKHSNLRYLLGDIRNKERVKRAVQGVNVIFHAAALKHVPLCEYNPYEAVKTNIIGTQNLVESARDEKVETMIAISTDKAVNPINTMGASKLLSEKLVLGGRIGVSKTKFSCVRFGNVLNSNGSVIPKFKSQIKKGGPVTITSLKMTRFFMSINEAVSLILKAGSITSGDEIFILKMPALKIIDLAKTLIKELSHKYKINPNQIKIKVTGIRLGEKIHECLLAEEELWKVKEEKDMYILKNIVQPGINNILTETITQRDISSYYSNNTRHLSQEEIKKILKYNEII